MHRRVLPVDFSVGFQPFSVQLGMYGRNLFSTRAAEHLCAAVPQ